MTAMAFAGQVREPTVSSPVNQERVRMLTTALRSGEFEQGKGYLNRDGKFCCLGVACEVAIRAGVDVTINDVEDIDSYGTVGAEGVSYQHREYDGEAAFLPRSVAEWYGFSLYGDVGNPILLAGSDADSVYQEAATGLNDNFGWTFEQIADAFDRTFVAAEA